VVDQAIDRLRAHLTAGEIVAGLGAGIIVAVSWLLFGFLLGHMGTWPPSLVMISSIALLAVLVVENARIHAFGPGYRLLVTGLCLLLGVQAVLDVLLHLRLAVGGGPFDIGGLTWWAGAIVAVIGGWMVWREGRPAA
jgi:hypothetical protein